MGVDLKWMSEEAMQEELELKKELIRMFAMQEMTAKTLDGLNFKEKVKDQDLANLVPECFRASDEELDVEKCGRMINDYEIEILEEMLKCPGARLRMLASGISLIEGQLVLKDFGVEFVTGVKWLWGRGLIDLDRTLPGNISLFKTVDPRAGRIYEVAKRLQSSDVETWELWRDMPSLYRLNDFEI
jgi:hypothetical protein